MGSREKRERLASESNRCYHFTKGRAIQLFVSYTQDNRNHLQTINHGLYFELKRSVMYILIVNVTHCFLIVILYTIIPPHSKYQFSGSPLTK